MSQTIWEFKTLILNLPSFPRLGRLNPVVPSLCTSTKQFSHLERPYLLLLCGFGYNVIRWPHCELVILLVLNIISSYINANFMEHCFSCTLTMTYCADLLS